MRNDFCSNYLAHSAKGTEWTNHRYIKKVIMPDGEPYYFYSMEQYQAYLKTLSGERQRSKTTFVGAGEYAKKEPNKDARNGIPMDLDTATKNRIMNNNLTTAGVVKVGFAVSLRKNGPTGFRLVGKVLEMSMSDAEKKFIKDADKLTSYLSKLSKKRINQARIRNIKNSVTELAKDPVGRFNKNHPALTTSIKEISSAVKSKKKKGK